MFVTDTELDLAYGQFSPVLGGRQQDYFAALYLSQTFDWPVQNCFAEIAFNGSDLGLDAFHFHVPSATLHLFLFNLSDDPKLFQESFIRLVHQGMERIFSFDMTDSEPGSFLDRLRGVLWGQRENLHKVSVNLVFNGEVDAARNSVVLEALRQHLERKAVLLDQYFEHRPVQLSVQYCSNATGMVTALVRTTCQFTVDFQEPSSITTPEGASMYIGLMRLLDLYRMLVSMEGKLLDRNIRFGLAQASSPNRAIRRALQRIVLERSQPPEMFAFHHNGITLHAEGFTMQGDQAVLTEPRLLNGAQTVSNFVRFLQEHESNPVLIENVDVLARIQVIAKVVCGGTDEFVSGITVSTNKQNPVKSWNLRANDIIQLQFAEKFRDELGIYYARQEGMPETGYLDEDGAHLSGKRIEMKRLAKTFLAEQGQVARMARMSELFDSEKLYQGTFHSHYLQADSHTILLCYKPQLRLVTIIRSIPETEARLSYLKRVPHLVWALVVQAMLNEPNLPELRREFGNQLELEPDFTNFLRRTMQDRIFPLIKQVVREEFYEPMLAAQEFRCLLDGNFYTECMRAAGEQWGWEQRTLPIQGRLPVQSEIPSQYGYNSTAAS